MLTNADCTVYNAYKQDGKTKYQRTVLYGVHFETHKGKIVQQTGVRDADSVSVYIPFSVDAGGKSYLPAKQWEREANKVTCWTLQVTGNTGAKIVKGVCEKELTDMYRPKDLEAEFDNVFNVMSVDTFDFGQPSMQHWEVSAK